ncbi:MAG: hypothetical protein AUK38_07395 [Nitrospirae bacterium CG2_30_41_42]|nr:MAG: hypothetical protein AUK38_07395 [Nitrospirae bacterium CG2_30_41_42]
MIVKYQIIKPDEYRVYVLWINIMNEPFEAVKDHQHTYNRENNIIKTTHEPAAIFKSDKNNLSNNEN